MLCSFGNFLINVQVVFIDISYCYYFMNVDSYQLHKDSLPGRDMKLAIPLFHVFGHRHFCQVICLIFYVQYLDIRFLINRQLPGLNC